MMSTTNSQNHRSRLLVLGMVIFASALMSGQACAQAAVIDIPHTLKTSLGWVAQYQQMINDYEKQIEQYKTQLKQYQQMQVNGDVYDGGPGYRERFNVRNINNGVDKRCGLQPNNNPVGPEQYDYCVAIVRTENRRFNAMANMLQDVSKRDKELQAAVTERKGIGEDEQGKLESNTNRVAALQSQLQNDVQNAQTLMNAYDAALRTLKDDQIQVGNRALKGKSSLLGNATQGLALKLALHAARARDR